MNIKELLLKGYELIDSFNNGYYKRSVGYYSKYGYRTYFPLEAIVSEKEKEKKNSEAVDNFKAEYQRRLYENLVYLITYFDNSKVFEKQRVEMQIKDLSKIFFDYLDSENDTYWQAWEIHRFISDSTIFPDPQTFTKKFVQNFIETNTLISITDTQNKKYTEETWFIVGLKFVDGTVYSLYNDGRGLTGLDLIRGIFEKEMLGLENKEKADFENKYKGNVFYTLGTLNNSETHSKNLFRSINKSETEKRWNLILKHCEYISPTFIEKFKKVYGYTPK